MTWLKEQVEILQKAKVKGYANTELVLYLNSITGKNDKTQAEAVSYLSKTDAFDFTRKIIKSVEALKTE